MFFTITLTTVAIMLLYAVPGFALIKSKLVKANAIPAIAIILMYVCQPCLTVYSFSKAPFSTELVLDLLIFFVIAICVMGTVLGIFYFVFHKKFSNIKYRVCTIATALGNCSFMGVPLLEAIFPDEPATVMFSLAFFLAMSILCWTVASYIISGDKKYISIKKMVLNPAVLSMIVAIPLWIFNVHFTDIVMDAITLLGKMTTPLCMLILGMRLATVKFMPIISSKLQYFVIVVKQLFMPMVTFAILMLVPLDPLMKKTLFIIASTPVASVVLNFAEMLGEGQDTAANVVLLGTLLSILTIPLMSLLLPFF